MTQARLLARTRAFALAVVAVVEDLPRGRTGDVIGTVLQEMGRKEEARAAFQEAVREADYPDFARKEAEAALAALNADRK